MAKKRKAVLPATPNGSGSLAAFGQQGGRHDLTYKKISDLRLNNQSLELSLFTGTILENCHFVNVNFDRCDFAGSKFIDCTFDQCSLDSIEIRSCFVEHCVFNSCNFKRSEWAISQVEGSEFNACDFDESSIREATFSRASFVDCSFRICSIVLDRFKACHFDSINLSDCTALFLFFDVCVVANCRMSMESVGYTYGLTLDNIDNFELSHLGQPQAKPKGAAVLDFLLENYLERHWYVGACALELNFRMLLPVHALKFLTRRLAPEITKHRRVEWHELQFLSLVLQRLNEEGRLPLIGIWPLYQLVQGAYATLQEDFPASKSFASAPELVLKRLAELLDDAVGTVSKIIADGHALRGEFLVELEFAERPKTPLSQLLPSTLLTLFESSRSDMQLLSAKEGSWQEVWTLSAGAFVAFHTGLVALHGVLKEFRESGDDAIGIFNWFRSSKKKPKERSKTKPKKAKKNSTKASLPMLVGRSLASQKRASVSQIAQMADEDLERLDRVVIVLFALPEERLRKFDDYSPNNLRAATVRPYPRRAPRSSR